MKDVPRIRYVPAGRLPDGTPLYDLYVGTEQREKALTLDEVLKKIFAFYLLGNNEIT